MSDQPDVTRVYAAGRQQFMGFELLAAPGALVPRAETELLGRTALAHLESIQPTLPGGPRLIDMCCGSGNLACALTLSLPTARTWAADLTDGCFNLACRNRTHLGIEDRLTVLQGDLFAPLQGLEGTIDLVVCNPPYISSGRLEKDRAFLLENEPREAFDGGPYGLTIHQRVIQEALPFLKPGAPLMFEMGLGQDRQLKLLFQRAGGYTDFTLVPDTAGNPRVAVARKA